MAVEGDRGGTDERPGEEREAISATAVEGTADAVWVLGDQLTTRHGPLARLEPGNGDATRVLMVESTGFAKRHPYHPHKLTLVFAAMRHFRDRLRATGFDVAYERAETFGDGLDAYFDAHPGDHLLAMRPSSHGAAERLGSLVADRGGSLSVVEDDRFLVTPDEFDAWAADRETHRQTDFYRWVRQRTGYLMDGDDPVGGQWTFDVENREPPPEGLDAPDPPAFDPDAPTREVHEWVREEFVGGAGADDDVSDGAVTADYTDGRWADPGPFRWPVTREQALVALSSFVADRLPTFGPYQDAMLDDDWSLYHAVLSPALNLGLLHPAEVVEAAVEAYHERDLPVQSVEGFVRQVAGWREYLRHVYRRRMPGLAAANHLGADRPLPDFYWTGETDMHCLSTVVDRVRRRGYSHHTERLMVLSNFALIAGVSPQALDRWFHAAYVDASHWVTTPNVVGMGVYGTDAVATKPYAASARYVDRMSDFCERCRYDPDEATGEDACPFNALYWDFHARNEDALRDNPRMALSYANWDRKDDETKEALRERAAAVLERLDDGEL